VGTDPKRIGEKARKEPRLVFTSLYHHITDIDNLRASYDSLLASKASGIDGVTKAEYGKHLEENLQDLSARLKRMGYRPSLKRRTYPYIDGRYGTDQIVSHSEMRIEPELVKNAQEILEKVDHRTKVVGIDEGRFFDPELVDACNQLANMGKRVIVAGLDQDHFGSHSSPRAGRARQVSRRIIEL